MPWTPAHRRWIHRQVPDGGGGQPLTDDQTGQCHVQRYLKPLLDRIQNGEIDPSFVITHRLLLEDTPAAYEMFLNKQDECMKVVLTP